MRVKVGNAGGNGALAVLSPAFGFAAFGLEFGNEFDQIGRKYVVVGVDDVLHVPVCGVVRGCKEKKIASALIDAAGILRGDEGQGGIEKRLRVLCLKRRRGGSGDSRKLAFEGYGDNAEGFKRGGKAIVSRFRGGGEQAGREKQENEKQA